jgi:hypothetical protein
MIGKHEGLMARPTGAARIPALRIVASSNPPSPVIQFGEISSNARPIARVKNLNCQQMQIQPRDD